MHTDPSAQVLYVWGRWVWYYRFLALVVYATGLLLLVGVYDPVRGLVRHPGIGNIVLLALLALLIGMWFLLTWITWRSGESRAARIALSADSATIVVRTLNFGSRRIPLADLEDFQYEKFQTYVGDYGSTRFYQPTLTVKVRGRLPLKIDLQGHILDEQTFKAIFHYPPSTDTPSNQRRKRKKRA